MRLLAEDIRAGDVWHDEDGTPFIVRQVKFKRGNGIEVKVSAGRTDPGSWISLPAKSEQDIYREEAR